MRIERTPTGPAPYWFQFSPDSNYLAFVTSFGTAALDLAVVSGGAPVQVATGVGSFSWQFQFSPDSSHLAFLTNYNSAGVGTLELAAVSGGTPVTLNDWIGQFAFVGGVIAAVRQGTPTPFSGQDGVYVTALP